MPDGLGGEEQAIYFSKVRKFFDSYACSRVMGRMGTMTNDYISREDVLKGQKTGTFANGIYFEAKRCVPVEYIESLEPADVVKVVRCKDCKHFYFADNRIPQEQRYVCEISGEIWKPDSFCSYGERKNDVPSNIIESLKEEINTVSRLNDRIKNRWE